MTIYPFENGNGRIGRAILDMALARADQTANRFYSLSTQLEKQCKHYYKQIEAQQRGTMSITKWLHWFLESVKQAILNAKNLSASIKLDNTTNIFT